MYTIIKIDETNVYIGTDEQKIVKVPISALNFADPQLGDEVKVYKSDDTIIIARVNEVKREEPAVKEAPMEVPQGNQAEYTYQQPQQTYNSQQQIQPVNGNEKRVNKHVFVWVGNFLFGGLGVDRFLRGQIGLGIVKLLIGWLTLGIWPLVDFIISLTKAYGNSFGNGEDVIFVNGKYAR